MICGRGGDGTTITEPGPRGGPLRGQAGPGGDRLRSVPGRDRAGRRGRRDRGELTRSLPPTTSRRASRIRGLPARARTARGRPREARRIRGHRGRKSAAAKAAGLRCLAVRGTLPDERLCPGRRVVDRIDVALVRDSSARPDDPRIHQGTTGTTCPRRRRRPAAARSRLPRNRPALSPSPDGSSTIPRRSGRACSRRPRLRSKTPESALTISTRSGSRINGGRRWSGSAFRAPVHRDRLAGPANGGALCELPADSCASARASSAIRTSRPRSSSGFWPDRPAAGGAGLRDDRHAGWSGS